MSGEFNGLKKLFCVFCGMTVIYIHCYCHRLHLIVIADLENIPDLADHLTLVSSLYNFFTIHKVKELYEGSALYRFMTTRWSGHYFAINTIQMNIKVIIKVLENCSTSRQLEANHLVMAFGLKHKVDDVKFMYVNKMRNPRNFRA